MSQQCSPPGGPLLMSGMPNSVWLNAHFRLIHSWFAKAMFHARESLIIWKDLCGHRAKMTKRISQEIPLKNVSASASTVSVFILKNRRFKFWSDLISMERWDTWKSLPKLNQAPRFTASASLIFFLLKQLMGNEGHLMESFQRMI